METYAKSGLNTEELFVAAAKLLYGDYKKYKTKQKKAGQKLKKDDVSSNQAKKKGCC
jgi:hypothetical protein